jgi:hypothetical protein
MPIRGQPASPPVYFSRFSICVNLRNLWIWIHPQITQIYADKDHQKGLRYLSPNGENKLYFDLSEKSFS